MKKIIFSLLIIISLFSHTLCAYAIEGGMYDLYSKGLCGDLLNYQGSTRITEYVVYNKNGKEYPAYCLNVEKKGVNSTSGYAVNVSDKLYDTNVWRTILFGYPYKSLAELGVANEQEAFTATKQAIYVAQGIRRLEDYSPFNTDAGHRTYNALVNIVTNARNSTAEEPGRINIGIISEDLEWKYNNNFIEKTFSIQTNIDSGHYEISILGQNLPDGICVLGMDDALQTIFAMNEKFKIRIPIQSLKNDGEFKIKCDLSSQTFPVLYGISENEATQDYALTYESVESSSAEYDVKFKKNLTKINIFKKEYETQNMLPNVEFELYNQNKTYDKTFVTDKDGTICIDNMIPGTYYLKEIKALDGYNLISDEIEIKLDYNEEVNVTVNNTKTKKELFEKQYENIEMVSNKEEKKVETNVENTSIENDYKYVKAKSNVTNKVLPKTGY